jgi:hypothetical protein
MSEDELEVKVSELLSKSKDEITELELKELKKYKYKLLRYININSYRDMLNKLMVKFKYDLLSPFDSRIVMSNRMVNYPMEFDELEKFTIGIEQMQKEKIVTDEPLFNKNKIISYFIDPRLGFYDIQDIASRFFDNNDSVIVYLPKKSSEMFAFYTLNGIDGNKKLWRMDSRIEDFGTDLAESVNEYCINYFKTLYRGLFGNNIFNSEFLELSTIYKPELSQLLKNIYYSTNNFKFCKIIGDVISKNCVLIPTDNHKFNITTDDRTQKPRFNITDECVKGQFYDIFKNLFDSVDTTNMLTFVEDFIKKC